MYLCSVSHLGNSTTVIQIVNSFKFAWFEEIKVDADEASFVGNPVQNLQNQFTDFFKNFFLIKWGFQFGLEKSIWPT